MKKKRAQLVCQHLENISRTVLEEHQEIVRNYVRRRQGVYALYRKGKLYYVGLAKNLRNRLKHHLKDRHGQSWDRFSIYLTIGDHHMKELESLMLRVMKPVGNKVKGKFARSEDLRRRFRRELTRDALLAVDGLFSDRPRVAQAKRKRPKRNKKKNALGQYVTSSFVIKGTHKGVIYRARVRRNGLINYKGKTYTSPSLAGATARKIGTNGWTFWHYERAPGDWVPLATLRR